MIKQFLSMTALFLTALFSVSASAFSDVMLINRGMDPDDGIMYVIFSDGGDLQRIPRGFLEANGVNIFNKSEVMAYLGATSSFVGDGLCGDRDASGCASNDSQY